MAYQISWLVEGRVMQIIVNGTTTVEEIQDQALSLTKYLDNGQGPLVHTFIDLLQLENFPINLSLLNNSMASTLQHSKVGWNIVITSNRMVKFLTSLVMQLSKVRFRTFATWEEGIAFLNDMDSTLPDLSPLHASTPPNVNA